MRKWPTEDELITAEEQERAHATRYDEEVDPVCECGNPGWACCCNELAQELGHWPDGAEYEYGD